MRCYKKAFFAFLVLLFYLLVACSPGASPASSPPSPIATQASSPSPTVSAGTILYQADWSHGLAGWHASKGWKVMKGFLQSDAGNNLSITIPYKPTVLNYGVEFRLQIVDVPKNGGFFRLSAEPSSGRDGYSASIFNLLTPGTHTSGLAPQLISLIEPDSHMDTGDAQIQDYFPGFGWKTYRVEVLGPRIVFSIDDIRHSQAVSTQVDILSSGPIHFTCGGVILRLSSLRIIAL